MRYITQLAGLLALSATLILMACTPDDPAAFSENLRLRHKGADMPVWVRGNMTGNKILLFLHGGPGECAICLREFFADVEKEMAVAYWDQRISGAASGNADPATLNYPQFAEDLGMVIKLLKTRYPDAGIYLLGHSFGVEMAWQFLTTGNNQHEIEAFVAMDGVYATYDWLLQVREWVMREAAAQGDAEALTFMQNHPITPENMRTVSWGDWYSRMFRLGANPVWPTDDKDHVFYLWFKTPGSKFSQLANIGHYDHYYAEEIFTFDRSQLLKNVTIPVALFWGKKDGIIPIEMAYRTQERLERAVPLVVFDNSWHSPMHTEQAKFSQALLDFVQEN